MKRRLKRIASGVLHFVMAVTWCALQTAVGFLSALCLLPFSRMQHYRGMVLVYHPFRMTFSLGTFAFVSDGVEHPRGIEGRMYGYYIQSLIYGPAFFFVVSLSQIVVRIPPIERYRAERGLSPERIFVERQARRLSARVGE